MKPGDLVRVKIRDLLYSRISGGDCLGACAVGEHLIVVDDHIGRNGNIKVIHPQLGLGFTHAAFLEVVDETR
jgi:hypothetical protein